MLKVMGTEILGVLFIFLLATLLAWPLARYIVKVFRGERTWSDFLSPLERLIFRLARIDPDRQMDWKESLRHMLGVNFFFWLLALLLLLLQGIIPFGNPLNFDGWEPTLAFNTAVSFATNTNLQHYSGETGASYLTQLLVFCWLQFVSAGTGIAACALLFQGLAGGTGSRLGNFYHLLVKSCTRILLPLAMVLSLLLTLNGTVTTLESPQPYQTLAGDTVMTATGPAAPMVAIKQLGTNGGGFFGPNSAHPFENPNYVTNILENTAILLIPISLVFAFGIYLKRRRLSALCYGVMTSLFVGLAVVSIVQENSDTRIPIGAETITMKSNMEGKEVRFGTTASAFWGVSTTSTSNGSVNSMHDSHGPLSITALLTAMFINAIYGGVGVGFINFFLFIVVAIFIAGLMIGRTPEFLGKKIEPQEMTIASLIVILHPFLILVGTALASWGAGIGGGETWLNNPSFHGFSEMLYEFTSASANNGSGLEGLGDNTPFWNILTGIVMMIARYLPIIGPLAIVGSLAAKKTVPESGGSLKVESPAFGIVLLAVIVIVAALSFFPALTLGPLAEFFTTV